LPKTIPSCRPQVAGYGIRIGIGKRHAVETGRVVGEEPRRYLVGDKGKRIGLHRAPGVEDVAPAGAQHPRRLAHRRVEIGDCKPSAGRQRVAQPAADDACSGGKLQHIGRASRTSAPGKVIGVVDEDVRPQAVVVISESFISPSPRLKSPVQG
jgi:hypothetical protein